MSAVATTPAPATSKFTALDRCDRCPGQARLEATSSSSGHRLLFCLHHATRFEDRLVEAGFVLHDEREALYREERGS